MVMVGAASGANETFLDRPGFPGPPELHKLLLFVNLDEALGFRKIPMINSPNP
jgi:hypothetical protein